MQRRGPKSLPKPEEAEPFRCPRNGLATKSEAARFLNVSAKTIDRLRADGELPFTYIGRAVRLDWEGLHEFASGGRVKGDKRNTDRPRMTKQQVTTKSEENWRTAISLVYQNEGGKRHEIETACDCVPRVGEAVRLGTSKVLFRVLTVQHVFGAQGASRVRVGIVPLTERSAPSDVAFWDEVN